MLSDEQKKYLDLLKNEPYKVGHWLGEKFNKLGLLHNIWLKSLIFGKDDYTLQAHRGSYKTTCVSIAFAIYMILFPNKNIIFLRKTDGDIKEIIAQVKNILESDVMRFISFKLYGHSVEVVKSNYSEITTNLVTSKSGAVQLLGIGIGGSLTGKHADWIHTDDIVNIKDRISKAERNFTKSIYMELQNIRNPGGRISNTGTPWHKEDCFSIMPIADKYDYRKTKLLTEEQIADLKERMSPSLFAANYELKHIISENALFKTSPVCFSDITMLKNGQAHIDAAYGGDDRSALTIARKTGNTIYLYGIVRNGHIDEHIDEFLNIIKQYMTGTIRCEDNADKGYLAKELRKKGAMVSTYHESTNKHYKISTYLKGYWKNIQFYKDTDDEYLSEILDYTEDAVHDDCPDSAASIVRALTTGVLRGF
jgi:hypothetical protein